MNIYTLFWLRIKQKNTQKIKPEEKIFRKNCFFERRKKPCPKIMQEKTQTEQKIKTKATAKTKPPTR